jgi:hypothetical protein
MNLSSARNHLHSLAERKAAFADYYSAHKDSECFDWFSTNEKFLIMVHHVIEWVKINGGLPPVDGASLL